MKQRLDMFLRLLWKKKLLRVKLIVLLSFMTGFLYFFERSPFFGNHPSKLSTTARDALTHLAVTNALGNDTTTRGTSSPGPSLPASAKNKSQSRKPSTFFQQPSTLLLRQSTVISKTVITNSSESFGKQKLIFTLADIQKEFGRNVAKQCKKSSLQFEKRACTGYREMKFMRNKTERVGLVSFPGSGNTWCRLLLEEMTECFTGSVYKDKKLLCGGMLGEEIADGSVVAIKTHNVNDWIKKMIFLYRNPWHAFVSYHTFQSFRDHTSSLQALHN